MSTIAPIVGMSSPWGIIDHAHVHAPGIVSVSTPSHGGIWLSPERLIHVPPALRLERHGNARNLTSPWFEEDGDAWMVVTTWPELFPDVTGEHAQAMLKATLDLKASFRAA